MHNRPSRLWTRIFGFAGLPLSSGYTDPHGLFVTSKRLVYAIMISLSLGFTLLASPAAAHSPNTGYSDIVLRDTIIDYELKIPVPDLQKFDPNYDNQKMEAYIRDHLKVTSDGKYLQMKLKSIHDEDDHSGVPNVVFALQYRSTATVGTLDIEYNLFFDDSDQSHMNFLLIHSGDDADQTVLSADSRTYHYEPYVKASFIVSLGRYVWLGVEHILTGYDHLLFLLSLIIIARRLKDTVRIVTAFSVAHSITLILVSTQVLLVHSQWVETGIALTICYVALENMLPRMKTVQFRWVLTFFFGLVHGMGFAGALTKIGLPKHNLIASLLSFNVGVELGQLSIVLALMPIILRLRQKVWYPKAVYGVSSVILLVALYWAAQRMGFIA